MSFLFSLKHDCYCLIVADGQTVIFKTEHLSTMIIAQKLAKLCQERLETVTVGESAIFASAKPGKIGKKK